MLKQILIAVAAAVTLAMPVAADPVGQPGRGGDGHCPIPGLATDPDCARESVQTLSKSSRDEFPAKCNKPECRNQFPGGRSAPPAPRAPRS